MYLARFSIYKEVLCLANYIILNFVILLCFNLQLREEFSLCRVYIKSKCLRAFDRRPSASTMIGTGDEMVNHYVQYQRSGQETKRLADHDQPTTTLLDQSSTRDHANPNSQTTEINDNWDMAVDDNYDTVWEWDMMKHLL